jgi:peptidoglycan/LPS O-acetylase OafA/YrhL
MKERYENLDGLRAISCLGIIALHVNANADYRLSTTASIIVSSFTQFVPLFLILSGFGMFCGYYNRFRAGTIELNSFYKKRYTKILPFFCFLILIDLFRGFTLTNFIEGFTEITLSFGLLPNNNLSVIGVSWTLGIIFLFYMLFPFFVWLCWDKKRAVIAFAISLALSLFCSLYFFSDKFVSDPLIPFIPRRNFLYCTPYFIAGGITYLFKTDIKNLVSRFKIPWFIMCAFLTVVWYFVDAGNILILKNILLFSPWFWYAISVNSKILNNRIMKYLGGISLEIYLAHMVIFRLIEKVNLLYIFGNNWISFILVWVMIVMGLLIFIAFWKKLYAIVRYVAVHFHKKFLR